MTDQLSQGVRQDVVTYTVKDRSGQIRGRAIPDREAAARKARALADDLSAAPLTIERVTYVSFTRREVVETVAAADGEAPL
jgi:hypothetical protein